MLSYNISSHEEVPTDFCIPFYRSSQQACSIRDIASIRRQDGANRTSMPADSPGSDQHRLKLVEYLDETSESTYTSEMIQRCVIRFQRGNLIRRARGTGVFSGPRILVPSSSSLSWFGEHTCRSLSTASRHRPLDQSKLQSARAWNN